MRRPLHPGWTWDGGEVPLAELPQLEGPHTLPRHLTDFAQMTLKSQQGERTCSFRTINRTHLFINLFI